MEGITVYSDQRVRHYVPERIGKNQKILMFYQSATQTTISVLFLYAMMAQKEKDCSSKEFLIPVVAISGYTCFCLKRLAESLFNLGR
jgi:hypothetical protein